MPSTSARAPGRTRGSRRPDPGCRSAYSATRGRSPRRWRSRNSSAELLDRRIDLIKRRTCSGFPMRLDPRPGARDQCVAVEQAGDRLEDAPGAASGPGRSACWPSSLDRPRTSATSALVSSSKCRRAMISRSIGSIAVEGGLESGSALSARDDRPLAEVSWPSSWAANETELACGMPPCTRRPRDRRPAWRRPGAGDGPASAAARPPAAARGRRACRACQVMRAVAGADVEIGLLQHVGGDRPAPGAGGRAGAAPSAATACGSGRTARPARPDRPRRRRRSAAHRRARPWTHSRSWINSRPRYFYARLARGLEGLTSPDDSF